MMSNLSAAESKEGHDVLLMILFGIFIEYTQNADLRKAVAVQDLDKISRFGKSRLLWQIIAGGDS